MMAPQLNEQPLEGLRVLVVEDDYFIAAEMCSALRKAGAEIVGPARDLESGLAATIDERLDCAVLDINLRGHMAFEIAARMQERNIPVIFATGYDASMIPPEFGDVVRMEKPVDLDALCRTVELCCL
jgi:DNA-binding response OmpR family regulator